MKYFVTLTDLIAQEIDDVAGKFECSREEILCRAPGRIKHLLDSTQDGEWELALLRRIKGGFQSLALVVPNLEEYRASGFLHISPTKTDNGSKAGLTYEVTIADADIANLKSRVKAHSPEEALGYSVYVYHRLLVRASEHPDFNLGIFSRDQHQGIVLQDAPGQQSHRDN